LLTNLTDLATLCSVLVPSTRLTEVSIPQRSHWMGSGYKVI